MESNFNKAYFFNLIKIAFLIPFLFLKPINVFTDICILELSIGKNINIFLPHPSKKHVTRRKPKKLDVIFAFLFLSLFYIGEIRNW